MTIETQCDGLVLVNRSISMNQSCRYGAGALKYEMYVPTSPHISL